MRSTPHSRAARATRAVIGCVAVACASAAASLACSSKPAPISQDDEGGSGSEAASGNSSTSGSGNGSGSGNTSSGQSGSGSGAGSGSNGGSGADSGAGSSGSDAGSGGPGYTTLDAAPDGPTIVPCGSGTCDLSTHTCCLSQDIGGNPTGTCITHGTQCPGIAAAFECGGAVDCPSNQVCCGEANNAIASAKTVCAATCPTMSTSSQQGQVQVCRYGGECQNHLPCIPQTCLGKAHLDLCGLTTQSPFDCEAGAP